MAGELTIVVRVIPRASKSELVGMVEGQLKIKIAAPPVDGAANAELIKVLSRYFDIAKRDIELVSGEAARVKKVRLSRVDQQRIDAFLNGRL